MNSLPEGAVAIIGMSGRFPGAPDVGALVRNLMSGVEGIATLSGDELRSAGVSPDAIRDAAYVPASGYLDGIEFFDAELFGIGAREASLLDPQQRIFLECARAALEHAGYAGEVEGHPVGVFAGAGFNTYLLRQILSRPDLVETIGEYAVLLGNDKDYLCTRVSYRLNLTGPSMTVQTACSTSLVAVATACQSLIDFQCDMALAGGVSISALKKTGYRYMEGGILSRDGHCRPFDARATGTVPASGVGIVVLKRLEDAVADRDTIHAVIRGWATNNDGSQKVGYTAPSVEAQARVISLAQNLAGVTPETVGYVETHGTGTPLGDPIEIAALSRVFGDRAPRSCVLGALKASVGHLDAASGVAGLIKATVAVRDACIPGTLHFQTANPKLSLEKGPFWVSAETTQWRDGIRRAGVSSFGIGGTNAHVVLEQAPPPGETRTRRAGSLFLLSARTDRALRVLEESYLHAAEEGTIEALFDAGYTTQIGRIRYSHRRALVARSPADLLRLLRGEGAQLMRQQVAVAGRSVAFLFPGQGSQFAAMGRTLYADEPVFRETVDQCVRYLERHSKHDIRRYLLEESDEEQLRQTELAQPLLFVMEYSLFALWRSLGVVPGAMIGHSLGEYVAACAAGVMTLEDALVVVTTRGRLMQAMPPGSMLSVQASPETVRSLLGASLEVAAENAPNLCVVSGTYEEVRRLESALHERGIRSRALQTSHAFHSRLVDGALPEFRKLMQSISLQPPEIPFVSNVTGEWIRAEQACSADYWVEHLRRAVLFSHGLRCIVQDHPVLLEVGPGRVLTTFAGEHDGVNASDLVATLPRPSARAGEKDVEQGLALINAIAGLWLAGIEVNWEELHAGDGRRRVPLPTYPFERVRHWVDEPGAADVDVHLARVAPEPIVDSNASPTDRVASAWRALLDLPAIGIDEDFFVAGGHSLLAIQLRSRLESAFGVRVSFEQLFEATTIRKQAALFSAEGGAALEAIAHVDRGSRLFLSHAQERLWFIEQLSPGNPAFHIPEAVRMVGALDRDALKRSLDALVMRHECLRASFDADGGGPFQRIADVATLALPFEDLSTYSEQEVEATLAALMRDEVRRPFDLSTAPLFRARLLRLAEREHLLVLTLHHMVADGWSMVLIERDLAAFYAANATGQTAALPLLPVGYVDYVAWQRHELEGDVTRQHLQYWRASMQGYGGVLSLPTDHKRPSVLSYEGARRYVAWPKDAVAPLARIAREKGATPFMAVLAVFASLLSRLSGQDDLVVGSPIACRSRAELEDLVGFFANTLPFRIDLSGDPSFAELVERVKRAVMGGFGHADTPFHLIVEAAGAARDLSRPPLVQAMFVLETMVAKMEPVAGLLMEQQAIDGGVAQVDLSLHLEEHADGYSGWWEYSTALFDEATIDRFDEQLRCLLDHAARAAELPMTAHSLRTPEGEETAWAHTRALASSVIGVAASLPGGFVHWAERTPEAVAVNDATRSLSYRDTHDASERIASALRRRGVKRGDRVLVLADRSILSVLSILAVTKIGAVYVPVDPANPSERMRFIASDCGPAICLSAKGFASQATSLDVPVLLVEDAIAEAPDSGHSARIAVSENDLAYMIYTSGTTGRPKGVELTHRAVLRLFGATEAFFRFGNDDVWVLLHSLAFDFSVWEMWGALLYGGRLVVAESEARDPAALTSLIAREGVTVLNQTPSAFRAMLQGHEVSNSSKLRWIIFGGEALELASLDAWFARSGNSDTRLVNMYGITETTVHVTLREILPSDAKHEHRSLIGRPLADLALVVLGKQMQLCAEGEIGEIFVAGAGLAHGYHGRPDLTAERFIPHPRPTVPGERLYRSGDLARVLRDGGFDYLGRADAQVKVRGFRIEPGEIELTLMRHPAISDVRVLADAVDGDVRLLAYWIPTEHAALTAAELRVFSRAALPDYMVPAHFVSLAHFPLTTNGKLDRRALPSPANDESPSPSGVFDEPRSPMEKLVARVFSELLSRERVGRDDSFFELGGHSLLAARLVFRLREETGVMCQLREFFEMPTVATLAVQLENGSRASVVAPIARRSTDQPAPLTEAQEEMFAFEQLRPDTDAFHVPIVVQIRGALDQTTLRAALTSVLDRHEALRMQVGVTEGRIGQRPRAPSAFPLSFTDLRLVVDGERDAARDAHLLAESATPFDLGAGELIRARLLRLADEQHLLLITVHHIAFDGWSVGLLVRDLAAFYRSPHEPLGTKLPNLPIQYGDYAAWERENPPSDTQRGYWRDYLRGVADVPVVVVDHAREGRESDLRCATAAVEIGVDTWTAIASAVREHGVTPYMVLSAAYALAIRARLSVAEVVIGSPVALRSRPEVANVIGCFLSTMLLRIRFTADVTVLELLQRLRDDAVAAIAHSDVPFGAIRKDSFASLTGQPFHSWFVLQNVPFEAVRLPGLVIEPVDLTPPSTKFELALDLTESDAGIRGRLFYRAALFDAETIERLVQSFQAISALLVRNLRAPVSQLLADLETQARSERDGRRSLGLRRRPSGNPTGGRE